VLEEILRDINSPKQCKISPNKKCPILDMVKKTNLLFISILSNYFEMKCSQIMLTKDVGAGVKNMKVVEKQKIKL
jgi:hypothetical protein